uniref:Uncharacterized protein n=1 Tax=Anguilla anguilla TaxID=7936 RepID=A0A0E9XNW5_ANGAN
MLNSSAPLVHIFVGIQLQEEDGVHTQSKGSTNRGDRVQHQNGDHWEAQDGRQVDTVNGRTKLLTEGAHRQPSLCVQSGQYEHIRDNDKAS